MANSSIAVTVQHGDHRQKQDHLNAIIIDWVGDDANGSVPTLVLPKINGKLLQLKTDPGSPAPTTLYDIAITDDEGFDVLQTVGQNRSATVTEQARIVYSGTSDEPYVGEWQTLTLAITGQSAVSAKGRIILTYLGIPV